MVFLLFSPITGRSQSYFKFNNNVKKQSVSFKFLSNLIVFPMEVNGEKLNFMFDSGGSDAMWLFKNSYSDIKTPKKFFKDYLGEGLSGSAHEKQSIVKGLVLGKFELKNSTVSFPDSLSIVHARRFTQGNGSLDANILKRFTVTFDYKKSKIMLKKGSSFREPFRYNRSGIKLVYNGKLLVKEKDFTSFASDKNQSTTQQNKVTFSYNFKPSYKIQKLQKGYPAEDAGLLPKDIVIKINGKYTHNFKLEEIVEEFYQKENKKITLVTERKGKDMNINLS